MKRYLSEKNIKALVESDLWENKLKPDCEKGEVFLAIRDNSVDFYHKGGRLFHFESGQFSTDLKYASVVAGSKTGAVKESFLASDKAKLIGSFTEGYTKIKKLCSEYTSVEAASVSKIYKKHHYLSKNNVMVLDIEINFDSSSDDVGKDRIDMLLFNKKTKSLLLVEAKDYSNKEIRSNGKAPVIGQIERYRSQLRKEKTILKQYSSYCDVIKRLFKVSLPQPASLEKDVKLFIFGFDDDQKKGGLRTRVINNTEYKKANIKVYAIGNPSGCSPDELWRKNNLI